MLRRILDGSEETLGRNHPLTLHTVRSLAERLDFVSFILRNMPTIASGFVSEIGSNNTDPTVPNHQLPIRQLQAPNTSVKSVTTVQSEPIIVEALAVSTHPTIIPANRKDEIKKNPGPTALST